MAPLSISTGSDDDRDKSTAAVNKKEDFFFEKVCDSNSQHAEASIPWLPEDIWFHIHSLMPIRDAARAACISRTFLYSWRHRPNLNLYPGVLYPMVEADFGPMVEADFSGIVDKIIRDHSGIGLKRFELYLDDERGAFPYVDSWLQIAVAPGIEVLKLNLYKKYKFPCSLFSDGVRNSIQDLRLECCVFRPTSELGTLRRLRSLDLSFVRITGDELECLLSNSPVLKQLDIYSCKEIIFLKIPYVLQQLSCLTVGSCASLRRIECKAPNLSIIDFEGREIELSLEQPLQMKKLCMSHANVFCYASELPSIMPNLEALEISSNIEAVNTPMLSTKFLHLKHLSLMIYERTPSFDYLSLVSFFDESPFLETFSLHILFGYVKHEPGFGDSSHLRQLPEHQHNRLKIVEIIGFISAKSLVELACCIVKNAVSLECITLDTLCGRSRLLCSGEGIGTCWPPISSVVLKQASGAVMAIKMYIEEKIMPTTKLTVIGPCARCHTSDDWYYKDGSWSCENADVRRMLDFPGD